jgi:hypothetical protein
MLEHLLMVENRPFIILALKGAEPSLNFFCYFYMLLIDVSIVCIFRFRSVFDFGIVILIFLVASMSLGFFCRFGTSN